MRALIINITTPDDAKVNRIFTLQILKDAAYNSKYKNPTNRAMYYDYVFVPMIDEDENYKNTPKYQSDLNRYLELLPQTTNYSRSINKDGYYSLGKFLEKNILGFLSLSTLVNECRFGIDVVNEISDRDFSISYTDGSFNKTTSEGGYCCLRVENNIANIEQPYLVEAITESRRNYSVYSGTIENATNNSAELTAIKAAVQNADDRRFQIIVSDCDYGMKSFREYIQNWRINGWKAANKKPIKNEELIKEIDNTVLSSNKIFLFQWTESHVGNPFNEKCDVIAKEKAGIQ